MNGKIMGFVQSLYCRFQDDEVPAMGAQLTYYLILSFFPFLIFLVAAISLTPLTTGEIISWITSVMPKTSNQTIGTVIEEMQKSKSHTLLSIGMIATIWSASNGVNAIIKAINKAYDEEENRPFWKVKGLSLLFTLILAVVIIFSFVMLIFGKWIGEQLFKFLHAPGYFEALWGFAKYAIPLVIMAGVFVLLYWMTPNRHLKVKDVVPGALFTTIGWIVTSLLFSSYVNNFGNYSKTYGSLGGIIVLLTWLYISSIIIVMGGEINATLAFDREGKQREVCKKYALPIRFLTKKNEPGKGSPETIKPLYSSDGKEGEEREAEPKLKINFRAKKEKGL